MTMTIADGGKKVKTTMENTPAMSNPQTNNRIYKKKTVKIAIGRGSFDALIHLIVSPNAQCVQLFISLHAMNEPHQRK